MPRKPKIPINLNPDYLPPVHTGPVPDPEDGHSIVKAARWLLSTKWEGFVRLLDSPNSMVALGAYKLLMERAYGEASQSLRVELQSNSTGGLLEAIQQIHDRRANAEAQKLLEKGKDDE